MLNKSQKSGKYYKIILYRDNNTAENHKDHKINNIFYSFKLKNSNKVQVPSNSSLCKVQVIITKKQGNAPARNKIKRIIKNILRNLNKMHLTGAKQEINKNYLMKMICYKNILETSFSDIEEEVTKNIEELFQITLKNCKI